MMKQLLRGVRFGINVYEGISPSLLATMSLSVNIKGSTHQQLIDNMVKAGLIHNQAEINAFKLMDRQFFTSSKNPYENKPYLISNKENMTDIFTHSVIVNNLAQHWRNNLKILDIGTGHGYLSFLIAEILQRRGFPQYHICGLDIHPQAIHFCHQLHQKLGKYQQNITFKCSDLSQHIETIEDNSLDIIIGGYYFQEEISDKLVTKLNRNGVGIWPTRSQHGQALYKLEKNKQKVYLIETLFSMPVVKSQVSKYFITEQDQKEEETASVQEDKQEMTVEQIKNMRKQMEQKLRGELKVLMQKHGRKDGKLLNLKEMRDHPEISAKLQQLQRLPKQKIKFQSR